MKKSNIVVIAIALLLGALFLITLFYREGNEQTKLPPGTHKVKVLEVLQTNNYTYLKVREDKEEYWMAIVSAEISTGDVLYYSKAMEMKDFKSRELDRTFPSVLFVDDASPTPPGMEQKAPAARTGGKPSIERESGININPPAGGITIADLFKSPGNYSEKTVTIRGKVVKFNPEIMHKNWVHIQDGTEFGGKYDLTVTTSSLVEVGQTVTFTGKIYLNRDFGSGYYYDVIMEEAVPSDPV